MSNQISLFLDRDILHYNDLIGLGMILKRTFWVLVILAAFTTGIVFANEDILTRLESTFGYSGSPSPTLVPAIGTIEVAFSPNNGATTTVINAIHQAQQSILVSAYSFTSKDIANALLEAKKSGINVKIILDKSQATQKYSSATFFTNQGFEMRIAIKYAIFHDKVMIIDDKTVVTGSFNFTKAAESKNAENVLIIRDNPELAKLYTQDWWYNWKLAVPLDEVLAKKNIKKGNENDE